MKFYITNIFIATFFIIVIFLIEGRNSDGFIIGSLIIVMIATGICGIYLLIKTKSMSLMGIFIVVFIVGYLLLSVPTMFFVGRPAWVVGVTTFERASWFMKDGLSLSFIENSIYILKKKLYISAIVAFIVTLIKYFFENDKKKGHHQNV